MRQYQVVISVSLFHWPGFKGIKPNIFKVVLSFVTNLVVRYFTRFFLWTLFRKASRLKFFTTQIFSPFWSFFISSVFLVFSYSNILKAALTSLAEENFPDWTCWLMNIEIIAQQYWCILSHSLFLKDTNYCY